MNDLLPLRDVHNHAVLDPVTNESIYFTEAEARVLIGQALATVRHGRGNNARYLVLKVAHEQARKMSKIEKLQESIRQRIRIPNAEPHCVPEIVYTKDGAKRVYKHVAHRCSAAQPFMEPVNERCM